LRGLYLLDNERIAQGKKTALVTAQARDLSGVYELIIKRDTGYVVGGRVTIDGPQTMSLKQFDELCSEHCVSSTQRRKWWPGADTLTVHPLTYSAYSRERPVEIAPSCPMCTELAGLGLKEIAVENDCYIYEVE